MFSRLEPLEMLTRAGASLSHSYFLSETEVGGKERSIQVGLNRLS